MLKIRKMTFALVGFFLLTIVGACGFTVEQHEDMGEETTSGASGTVLAGQEAPEITGTIESIESEEVVITVDGQEVTFRLSEDSKKQIQDGEVDSGDAVTFTTYSIGDDKQTIDQFILE
ncbi:hypothetical protein ACFSCX_16545 [Bacillus salitolerans]|uniref:DUF3221 domain-containing protein n=1 Tax=Bacillus salitolerans TaxID=1437434 RepID=A0ABW4LSU8_9BACI